MASRKRIALPQCADCVRLIRMCSMCDECQSSARKQASARIAKIPLPLSRYIAQVYRPVDSLR